MNGNIRGVILKYGGSLLFSALCIWGVMASNSYSSGMPQLEKYRILCDAVATPGVMLTLFGGLIWVASEGALDGLSWAMTNLYKSLIPGLSATKESYRDYLERKHGNKVRGYGFMFVVGIFFLVAAAIFLILYLRLDI